MDWLSAIDNLAGGDPTKYEEIEAMKFYDFLTVLTLRMYKDIQARWERENS